MKIIVDFDKNGDIIPITNEVLFYHCVGSRKPNTPYDFYNITEELLGMHGITEIVFKWEE